MKFKNIVGERFERLLVVECTRVNKLVAWKCLCDCGNTIVVRTTRLGKDVKSCGCFRKEILKNFHLKNTIHGMSGTVEYESWVSMMFRCYNPKSCDYKNYGGRGIKVCERWSDKKSGFLNFLADMGKRPAKYSIERIDVNGNYEPSNCKWIPNAKQARNKRNNVFLTFNGETHCINEWATILGLKRELIKDRLRRGWSVADALTKPLQLKRPTKLDFLRNIGKIA